MPTKSALIIIILMAMIVTGCGSSARLEYERDLAKVGRGVDNSLEELPKNDTESIDAEHVSKIAEDLREAANQLEDLEPPADASRAQARLERGLRGVATAFDLLAENLRKAKSDADKADLFVKFATDDKVDTAFDDLIAAQKLYMEKGYRVFGTDIKNQKSKS